MTSIRFSQWPTTAVRLVVAVGLAIGVVAAFASPASADAPAPATPTAKYEIRFLEGMINHHAMAVEEGEICLDRATHEELLALCQNIIATQSQEIELMQSWLSDWYGESHEPHMNPGQMNQMEKMASLTGEEFEIDFMTSMIRHHQQAIRDAERCVDRAYHDELVQLCQGIIDAQRAEIEQMQTWLCDWYSICRD